MSMLVFGADGGGTKTSGLVANREGTILARRTVEGSNVNVVGVDAAARALLKLIVSCCTEAESNPTDLQAIVLGLAGAGSEDNRTQVRERICKLFGSELPITIETDARVALEGALDGAPGIAIIAGTGSVVLGKKSSGDTVMTGGWGRVFGDEGSGFWLGLEVLRSLALLHDGRGGSRVLAELIDKEFGLKSREQIIKAVYREGVDVSKFAPLVTSAADEGDTDALGILDRGATILADQASAVVAQVGINEVPVAFLGGLIDHDCLYARILKSKIEKTGAVVRAPSRTPVEGAVLMALRSVVDSSK